MRKLTYKEVRKKFDEFNSTIFLGCLTRPGIYIYASSKDDPVLGVPCAGSFETWENCSSTRISLNMALCSSEDWEEVLLHEIFHLYNLITYTV